MAKRTIVIDLCDRCGFGKESPATTERVFTPDGDLWYMLKLCEKHAEMYDRDMIGWTRLAADIDAPNMERQRSVFFTEERKRETERLRELTGKVNQEAASRAFADRRLREIELENAQREELLARQRIPGALDWRLVNHARERMLERNFTIEEVLRTAAQPAVVRRQPWRGPEFAVHERDDCRVVVNDQTKAIITVINRNSTLETEESHRQAQATAVPTEKVSAV